MAYDRNDTRDGPRDERSRWRDERGFEGGRGGDNDRGFFERAGDEIASWFGDDEAERRRREDQRMEGREGGWNRDDRREFGRGGFSGRDHDRSRPEDRGRFFGHNRNEDRGRFDRDDDRGFMSSSGYRGTSGETGRRPSAWSGSEGMERGYRPMTGDYSRSEGFFAASGVRGGDDRGRDWREREPFGRDEYRRTSYSGSDRSGNFDPHYHSWRQRQVDELDRDYDEYRRENQARFENDFSGWRERRMQKRGLLGQIREHMEVVGSDSDHVGTIDRVAGDRIILTKSDPESGGAHHSLSCSDIDRVEGDRVILDCSAEQARQRWRDESRNRALFEREDQGEMGDRVLDRSFGGTYR